MDDYSKLKIDYDKVCEENYKLKKEELNYKKIILEMK